MSPSSLLTLDPLDIFNRKPSKFGDDPVELLPSVVTAQVARETVHSDTQAGSYGHLTEAASRL